MQHYPLTAGNKWEYKQKNGNTYSNEVTGASGNLVTMKIPHRLILTASSDGDTHSLTGYHLN